MEELSQKTFLIQSDLHFVHSLYKVFTIIALIIKSIYFYLKKGSTANSTIS